MRIAIRIGTLSMEAELNETPTAQKIAAALPLRTSFNTWGDEIYFAIPVDADLDDSAQDVVELGDLGYWPPGKALVYFLWPDPSEPTWQDHAGQRCQCHWESPRGCYTFKTVMREREVIVEAR